MGIVDWFTNDLSTEERALTRDLLSVALPTMILARRNSRRYSK